MSSVALERKLFDLSHDGAVRLTDYSTTGAVATWKVGADWEPHPPDA